MSESNGFVGNVPINLNSTSGTTQSNPRPRLGPLKEKKIADALLKHFYSIDLDIPWLVFSFVQESGTAMQLRMYDFCMSFLRHWANRYDSKEIKNSQVLYDICRNCSVMVKALDAAEQAEYNSPRARRLRRQALLNGESNTVALAESSVDSTMTGWDAVAKVTESNRRNLLTEGSE